MSKPLSLEQKAFNAVVKHARKQGCKAKESGYISCFYRLKQKGCATKKCFIGALIPNRMYKPEMEQNTFPMLLSKFGGGVLSNWKYLKLDKTFGNELQNIHDNREVYNWEDHFENFAKTYKLKYTPPVAAS